MGLAGMSPAERGWQSSMFLRADKDLVCTALTWAHSDSHRLAWGSGEQMEAFSCPLESWAWKALLAGLWRHGPAAWGLPPAPATEPLPMCS